MNIAERLSPPARIAIIGAAVVIVLAGARASTPILTPLLVAVFFAMITAPAMVWLTRRGVPRIPAAILVVAGLIGIFAGMIAFLGAALTGFVRSLPQYQARLDEQLAVLQSILTEYGITPGGTSDGIQIGDYIDQGFVLQQAAELARQVGSIAVDAFLVIVGIGFLLVEAPRIAAVLTRYLGVESPP
ncbi:MAG: AI-2E family transporter, partial [Methanoculleus sp.]|nr:AI-2E family transporter [Methanoculleus sp.]